MITSNLDYTLANLSYFMAGRDNHKKSVRAAQEPSGPSYGADNGRRGEQRLAAPRRRTYNLLTNCQIQTGVERRRRSRGA